MQFLKKHYEKIILSAVLLGLAAAAFWLSSAVKDAQGKKWEPEAAGKTAWTVLDLTKERAALAALHTVPLLDLSGAHNLFNPVTWKRLPNGRLVKVLVEGAAALTVTDIRPLYWQIIFDSKVGDGYRMIVKPPPPGRQTNSYSKLNEKDKTKPFVIVGTNDAPDGSPILQLQITDTGETASVTMNNPYKRVDSYEADLKYTVDSTELKRKRVGDAMMLSETQFKIIVITNNAVTVQDSKNSQKTTIPWIGAH